MSTTFNAEENVLYIYLCVCVCVCYFMPIFNHGFNITTLYQGVLP